MSSLNGIEALIETRQYEQAEARLAAVVPEDDRARAEAAYYRGLILEGTDRWAEAIDAYSEAVDLDEDNLEATFRLAYVLDLHGQDEEALELYERCVADPPLSVNALLNLVSEDALAQAVSQNVPKGTEKLNLDAVQEGITLARQWSDAGATQGAGR